MKRYLFLTPLLAKPEDGEPLFLYLVVSNNATNVVLVKEHDGTQHPVYYVTKSFLDVETRF